MADHHVLWPAARPKYAKPIALVTQNRPERFVTTLGAGLGRITMERGLLCQEEPFGRVMDFFDPHVYDEEGAGV